MVRPGMRDLRRRGRDLAVGSLRTMPCAGVRPSRPGSAAPARRVLIHDPLERRNGGGGRRERTDFVAYVPCALAVGGFAQHGAHRCADHCGVALGWPDDAAGPRAWQRLAQ